MPPRTSRVTLRVPRTLHRALKLRAVRRDSTVTAEVEAALRAWLAKERKEAPHAAR